MKDRLIVTSDGYEQVKKPAEGRCFWNKELNGNNESQRAADRAKHQQKKPDLWSEVKWPWSRIQASSNIVQHNA